ncbi:ABC-2 type transport system permease protein [Streptomyces sp. SAI-208]|uniref:ABC transporter permease n=1 Tax=unclassified Streptomyces TaxID=2593676 RepID=UPI002473B6D1|nr:MULTISPECIES: ABC-2 family transporter protein [unclassified Streptomyces]MDH6515670.1 ABC-2 type transport system permease protein [Streptomyces sp. SAI-090]MDH6588090.1 ABC-2 type transport system permease protein [Streptomyces sp. SAI-133]MDH6606506.1 ABC-2 type transport system permease protein [Streptomyces sp. SAI-208]MDH6620243.1 ABC-2 type transport system permease protein [Streptomyces sp. SAI-135]
MAVLHAWRAARVTPLGELHAPPRMTAVLVRLVVQVVLVASLWHGLYSRTGTTAGLAEGQAVSYAVLAVLASRLRELDQYAGRDTVLQHMHFGTIVYWYLRPLPPQRYHALRALGEQLYGFAWALGGYLVCLAAGVVDPPGSAAVAGVFALSLLLGQWVLYHVMLMLDQLCFWTVRNNAAMLILIFAQNLLSGVYAPLWFFPDWFITLSGFLPFQATLSVPLSIYIGRIPLSDAWEQLAVQAFWGVALTLFTRFLWRRAARRVISQGG